MKTPRRWMAWILSMGMVVTVFPGSTYASASSSSISLEVNGQVVRTDVPPSMKEGRVLVPLRWVAEALEAKVHWDSEKRAVLIDTDAGLVPAPQGRAIGLWVDGRKLTPDAAPVLSKGRTLVSVRVVAEALGAKVEWNAKERTVTISRPQAALGQIAYIQWREQAGNWGFSRHPEYVSPSELERRQAEALDRLQAAIGRAAPAAPPTGTEGERLVLDLSIQERYDDKGARIEGGSYRLTVSGPHVALEELYTQTPATIYLRSAGEEVLRELEAIRAMLPSPFPERAATLKSAPDAALKEAAAISIRSVETGLPDGWHGELAIDPESGGYAVAALERSASGAEGASNVWFSEDGADWRRMELPETLAPAAIGFAADGVRLISDRVDGHVYRSDAGGGSPAWERVWEYPLPEAIYKYPPVRFIPDLRNAKRIYATFAHDTRMPTSDGLFRSEDGGKSWTWGGVNGDDRMSFSWPERVWADPGTPGRVFAETDVSILLSEQTYNVAFAQPDVLVSEDGGLHWSAIEGVERFYGAGADASGSVLIGGRTEGADAYLATAGADAAVWTERRLPFRADRIAVDPAAPDTLAATGQRPGEASREPELFLSFDRGATWASAGTASGAVEHVDAEARLLFIRDLYELKVFRY
ncbi:copper amine oxidase N-terminal domain-containing protein [Paenibacillus antri]|uniref:Copper amine oxidase N-terminal domain-containing protein n=1 Tax=Paenibacillus antri TaxID=2582848 RepID=A0A5R9GEB1_9BACL|nr:stalk domain-containing protein [Paenibacillus antri]TLS51554.1 copper amine oxidase N-terminal domain-containing protein [Paenibacillus antri]